MVNEIVHIFGNYAILWLIEIDEKSRSGSWENIFSNKGKNISMDIVSLDNGFLRNKD